ncbi:MAG TPA: response regulator transcription factor [Oligoflexia bacterium]|nr:response regulator transcription factor [Oligoflexia bacterium]
MTDIALIIEDDDDLGALLAEELGALGYKIDRAADGKTGLELALSKDYSFIVLDLMLPQLEGTEVCRKIRERKPYQPLIVLTAKNTELDRVLLLEHGADDYVTKPFSIAELKARIKTVLRRSRPHDDHAGTGDKNTCIACGELHLDTAARTVTLGGKPIEFTAREFEIIALLAASPGRVFSRDQMVEAMYGEPMSGYDAAITAHVNRIRSKLEPDPANPIYLQTVRAVGYRIVDPKKHE